MNEYLHILRDKHLMTRIAIDSKKTQQELDTILGRLKRSWIEVPAGGGKRFLQPQYQVWPTEDTTSRTLSQQRSNIGDVRRITVE